MSTKPDTPETDAATLTCDYGSTGVLEYVPVEFAESLERRLRAAQAENAGLRTTLSMRGKSVMPEFVALRAENAALRERIKVLENEKAEYLLEVDGLFDALSQTEVAGRKIPTAIARWWQRATERREAARAALAGKPSKVL